MKIIIFRASLTATTTKDVYQNYYSLFVVMGTFINSFLRVLANKYQWLRFVLFKKRTIFRGSLTTTTQKYVYRKYYSYTGLLIATQLKNILFVYKTMRY